MENIHIENLCERKVLSSVEKDAISRRIFENISQLWKDEDCLKKLWIPEKVKSPEYRT